MAKSPVTPKQPDTYRFHALRPMNSLVFILPMLLLFHVGSTVYDVSLLAPAHLRRALEFLGASAAVMPAALVVAALLIQHLAHKDPWQFQPKVLAGMLGESIVWMIPLIVMIRLSGRLLASLAQTTQPHQQTMQRLLLAVGAGVYEEFIFRLVLISLTMLVFVEILGLNREHLTVLAVIVTGALFSLYHLSTQQLTHLAGFPWRAFVFRTAAGVYLGTLFVFRGFGITVGAHAFYNIYALIADPS